VTRTLLLAALLLTLAGAAGASPTPVEAQVQSPPAVIRGEEGMESSVAWLQKEWPRLATPVAEELGLASPRPVLVVLLQGKTFRRWSRGLIPEWGVGYANWPDGPIAIDIDAALRGSKTLEQIVQHEISHVYLGQRLEGRRPPTWFVEGVAQRQSGEWTMTDTMALVEAASVGRLPRLSQLVARFPAGGRPAELAYRVSLLAVQDIDRRLADRGGFAALVARAAETGRFDTAFTEMTGLRLAEFELQLAGRLRGRYGWIAAIAGAGTLFTAMTFLFLLGTARAHWRKRKRLAAMAKEEAGIDDSEGEWNQTG
jgi:hypothetical protein